MAPLARYPDAQSPYWIERRNGCFNVHHEHFGLIAECDCLQEARHQISDAEDEAEAAAAQEAREIAEADAATERFDAVMSTRRAA